MTTNEELRDLEQEVSDCEKSVADDTETLANDKRNLDRSKVWFAEAIIRLHNFKKQHGL